MPSGQLVVATLVARLACVTVLLVVLLALCPIGQAGLGGAVAPVPAGHGDGASGGPAAPGQQAALITISQDHERALVSTPSLVLRQGLPAASPGSPPPLATAADHPATPLFLDHCSLRC